MAPGVPSGTGGTRVAPQTKSAVMTPMVVPVSRPPLGRQPRARGPLHKTGLGPVLGFDARRFVPVHYGRTRPRNESAGHSSL